MVAEYFAQDEATRLDPVKTVYETLVSGSPMHMVPAIRNILGGFLFSGDDIYKKCGVLSGGERTRLAVARMLLRPSNLLLLDEPTNHLDLDSKDVLLDALVDYGGTLIFVSHDRYFVERLATRIIEVGGRAGRVVPGHVPGVPLAEGAPARKSHRRPSRRRTAPRPAGGTAPAPGPLTRPAPAEGAARPPPKVGPRAARKREQAEQRKRDRERKARQARRGRSRDPHRGARRRAIKDPRDRDVGAGLLRAIATPRSRPSRAHQTLMWEVGELMHQWEMLAGTDGSGHAG